jgi:hypothetical protein
MLEYQIVLQLEPSKYAYNQSRCSAYWVFVLHMLMLYQNIHPITQMITAISNSGALMMKVDIFA